MFAAKITFSNGDTLMLNEDSIVDIIRSESIESVDKSRTDNEKFIIPETSYIAGRLLLDNPHTEAGLIPDLTAMLHNSDFFYIHNQPDIVYASASVYKIESYSN